MNYGSQSHLLECMANIVADQAPLLKNLTLALVPKKATSQQ
jgi:hypothetical protein